MSNQARVRNVFFLWINILEMCSLAKTAIQSSNCKTWKPSQKNEENLEFDFDWTGIPYDMKSYVGFVSNLFATVESLLHRKGCHLCRHSVIVVGNLSQFEMEWELWKSGAGSPAHILSSRGNEPTQLDSCCSDSCRNLL